jgi:hypothetical protein
MLGWFKGFSGHANAPEKARSWNRKPDLFHILRLFLRDVPRFSANARRVYLHSVIVLLVLTANGWRCDLHDFDRYHLNAQTSSVGLSSDIA